MKKFLTLAAIFALVFTGCLPDDEVDKRTWLKIRNESSKVISRVNWNYIAIKFNEFADVWLEIYPGQNVRGEVEPGYGYIYFHCRLGEKTANLRTRDFVTIEKGEDKEFIILETTIVVDLDNQNNTGTLSEIVN